MTRIHSTRDTQLSETFKNILGAVLAFVMLFNCFAFSDVVRSIPSIIGGGCFKPGEALDFRDLRLSLYLLLLMLLSELSADWFFSFFVGDGLNFSN